MAKLGLGSAPDALDWRIRCRVLHETLLALTYLHGLTPQVALLQSSWPPPGSKAASVREFTSSAP